MIFAANARIVGLRPESGMTSGQAVDVNQRFDYSALVRIVIVSSSYCIFFYVSSEVQLST